MRNRDLFDALEGFCAGGDVMDRVKDLGAVVPHSTSIANADCNSLQYDEPLLVLKSFAVDFLWPNGTLAVLAHVAVDSFLSGIC